MPKKPTPDRRDDIDPRAYELMEFIRKAKNDRNMPAWKKQALSGYRLPPKRRDRKQDARTCPL